MSEERFTFDQSLFYDALLAMERDTLISLAEKYPSAPDLAEAVLVPCLEEIGSEWEQGDIALAQVYICSKLCEEVLEKLFPDAISDAESSSKIGIVLLEDYHSLGKTIVQSSLLSAGYSATDLGRMEVEEIVAYLKESPLELLFISVLMLPAALQVRNLKQRIDEEGILTKLVVGGAPFRLDDKLWQEVGADDYGAVASDAIGIVKRLLEEKP